MTNESEHTTGSHPVGASGDAPPADGPDQAADEAQAPEGSPTGWGGSAVVRDHAGQSTTETGWDADRVMRDQGGTDEPAADAGWTGQAVAKDQGEVGEQPGGWSSGGVVKDHGDPGTDRAE